MLETSTQDSHEQLPKGSSKSARSGRGLPFGYVIVWAAAGVISAGYIGVATFASVGDPLKPQGPILVERGGGSSSGPETSVAINKTLKQRLIEKRKSLAEVVDELEKPVAKSSTAVASKAQNGPGVLSSKPVKTTAIAGLRREAPAVSAENQPADIPVGVAIINGPKTAPAPKVMSPDAAETTAVQVAENIAKPVAPKIAPVITGSLKPPPLPIRAPVRPKLKLTQVAAAPPVTKPQNQPVAKKPAATGFGATQVARAPSPVAIRPSPGQPPSMGVRLAKAPSVDALRLQWTLLRERHGQYLGALTPRYIQSSTNGGPMSYELVAGPVDGAIQALELCQDVSRSGTRCVIGDFVGNAL